MYLHDSVESLCGRKDPRNIITYFSREEGFEGEDPVVGIEDEDFRDGFLKLIHKYPRFIHNLNFQEADTYTYFVLDIFGGANSYQNTFIEEPSTCQLKAVTIRKVNSTSIYVNLFDFFPWFVFIRPAFEYVDELELDCDYVVCLNSMANISSPLCTKSGLYSTKEHYCKAFLEGEDINQSNDCTELDPCNEIKDMKVCGGHLGLMTHAVACDYKVKGYIHDIHDCEGEGCIKEEDCFIKRCKDSFKGMYCSLMNVCMKHTALFYPDRDSYCEANPFNTVDDIVAMTVNTNGNDFNQEVKNQAQCCQKNLSSYFCDADNDYVHTKIKDLCASGTVLTENQKNNSYFHNNPNPTSCETFNSCMTNPSFTIEKYCLTSNEFYHSKRDFCVAQKDDLVSISLNPCASDESCTNKRECRISNCPVGTYMGIETCAYNYHIIVGGEEFCHYIEDENEHLLKCGADLCPVFYCVNQANTNERELSLNGACHPVTYDHLTDLVEITLAILENSTVVNIHNLILCDGPCNPQKCFEMSPQGRCESAINLSGKVCGYDLQNFSRILFDDKRDFCSYLISEGITSDFANYGIDGSNATSNQDCFAQCIAERKDVCDLDNSQLVSNLKSCVTQVSDRVYDMQAKCINSDFLTRDCDSMDCCPTELGQPGALHSVCTNNRKDPIMLRMHFCQRKKKDLDLELFPMPRHFPACGSNNRLYKSRKAFCLAKHENPDLSYLDCNGRPCNRVTCCLKQCGNEDISVVVQLSPNKFRGFSSGCKAKCFRPRAKIVHTCDDVTSSLECYIQKCVQVNHCDRAFSSVVCAENGRLYDSTCEAKKCRGLRVLFRCPPRTPKSNGSGFLRDAMEIRCRHLVNPP